MNPNNPKVSVILPVYNREKYVADAVKSILNQSFTDFEFIIIDDGSIDSTFDILKSFNDKRIKLVRKNKNKGNYSARNEGMELATGKYICVMDSDDIALPNRIQRQFEFMEQHKQFGICGSFAKVIDSDEIITAPEDYDEIKVWSMSNIMFRHPTVFIRAEFLKKYNLKYNDYYRYAGDYDFLVKAAHLFPVTNIQEVLLEYRRHPEQISTANRSEQVKVAYSVMLNQLAFFMENANDVEKQLHLSLMNRFPIKDESDFKQLREWANFLQERNNQTGYYHQAHLANFFKSLLKYIYKQYEISKKEHRISSLLKNQKLVDFGSFKCEIQKLINTLYSLYNKKDDKIIIGFLSKWYGTNKPSRKEMYQNKVPEGFDIAEQTGVENKALFEKYKIPGTPTIFINGHKYPTQYEYSDIEYYIEDIKSLTLESKRQEACTTCN